jgi:holliday junction DNA helicase RuvA
MHERWLYEKMPGLVRSRSGDQRQQHKTDSAFEFSRPSATESGVMIAFLEGVLEEALPTQIVVNVHGVGYHVMIPLSSFERLSHRGSHVKILTHLVVREDSHILFGFGTAGERDLFRLLMHHVSGVGPKLALAILSGMSVEMFKAAVISGDIAAISRVSGVGKKTAERVVLELKDKVGVAAEWEAASAANAPSERDQAVHDAVLALISLGYKQLEAHKAIKQSLADAPGTHPADELVRMALKILA